MSLTYILTLLFQPLLPKSRPMTSHHVTCHVTTVMCLFIVQKKKKSKFKRKEILNQEKIDKKKFMSKHITLLQFSQYYICFLMHFLHLFDKLFCLHMLLIFSYLKAHSWFPSIVNFEGTSSEVVKPQVSDGMVGKFSGFITVCKLFLRMRMREDVVEEQIQ